MGVGVNITIGVFVILFFIIIIYYIIDQNNFNRYKDTRSKSIRRLDSCKIEIFPSYNTGFIRRRVEELKKVKVVPDREVDSNISKWNEIEELNSEVKITHENSYIDNYGYLRWNKNYNLCHRDIAWENNIRGSEKFSDCDVHHIDGNKLNNNVNNLKVVTRQEHQIEHGDILFIDGKKYCKLSIFLSFNKTTTSAYLIANKWISKSQVVYRNKFMYIPEWLYKEKGFG